METFLEICKAVYSLGLIALGVAILAFLPVGLRVIRDLTAALGAFTSALSATTAAADGQRKILALTERIAAKLGIELDP